MLVSAHGSSPPPRRPGEEISLLALLVTALSGRNTQRRRPSAFTGPVNSSRLFASLFAPIVCGPCGIRGYSGVGMVCKGHSTPDWGLRGQRMARVGIREARPTQRPWGRIYCGYVISLDRRGDRHHSLTSVSRASPVPSWAETAEKCRLTRRLPSSARSFATQRLLRVSFVVLKANFKGHYASGSNSRLGA